MALSGFVHFPSMQVHALLGCEVPWVFQKVQERPTMGQNRLALLTTQGTKGTLRKREKGERERLPSFP